MRIQSDSVNRIQKVLDEALANQDGYVDIAHIGKLKTIFGKRQTQFVKTSQIESELGELGQSIGIDIFRGADYGILAEGMAVLFEPGENQELSERQQKLKAIFKNAKVVVGADGAHSEVRKAVMGKQEVDPKTTKTVIKDHVVDQQTLQYLIELFKNYGIKIVQAIVNFLSQTIFRRFAAPKAKKHRLKDVFMLQFDGNNYR